MKHTYILYIGMSEGLDIHSKEWSVYLVRLLLSHYHVDLIGDLFHQPSKELRKSYDLVIVQNSSCFIRYEKFLRQFAKSPVLFIATMQNVNSYVAPFENLYCVLNMGVTSLSSFGIPAEMQLSLNYPIEKIANYSIYEQQPENCRIVYCPTGNSIQESDIKLLTFLKNTNTLLTILSDNYQCLKNSLPPFVTIKPRHLWFSAYKNAHLVVASGFDAVRAMALCKPCVILGDYGLGGLVTPDNYSILQSVNFRGRKGAYFNELVPADLLENEIRKVFVVSFEDTYLVIQKRIISDYSKKEFDKRFLIEIEKIFQLSSLISNRSKKYYLKPQLSSLFSLEESEGKQFLLRGMNCFGELDNEMVEILKQCNGTVTIHEIIKHNAYDKEDAVIFWENLYELWKEKLILFES